MIRAVVFDFDGLILDTESAIFDALVELFAEHGGTIEEAEWASTIGTHAGMDEYAVLLERATTPPPPREEFARLHEARVRQLLEAEQALPGVLEWLEAAAELGLKVGIASSSSAGWVNGHVERLGLAHHFAVVSTRGEGVPAKPAPDVYLRACEALEVDPADAVAVEDSPNGIAAAKAAGLACVAVPNRLTRPLDLSAADLVVETLADLPLAELVSARGGPPSRTGRPGAGP